MMTMLFVSGCRFDPEGICKLSISGEISKTDVEAVASSLCNNISLTVNSYGGESYVSLALGAIPIKLG